jgi:hypothetical protein
VQIAVDALRARARERTRDRVGDLEHNVAIASRERHGDELAGKNHVERLCHVEVHRQSWPVGRIVRGADRMHASDEPPDLAQQLVVAFLQRPTAHFRERGVVDPVDLGERGAGAEVHRWHGRQLRLRQLAKKRVLVENRLARPAAGTIELHDQAPLVLELDLVDAVLEGTQRNAPAGAAQPPDLDRVEDAIGREGVEARRFAHSRASSASSRRSASGYTVIGIARPLRSMVRAASTRAMAPPRASAAAETRISPAPANA